VARHGSFSLRRVDEGERTCPTKYPQEDEDAKHAWLKEFADHEDFLYIAVRISNQDGPTRLLSVMTISKSPPED
jgi:hypothetical protein